MEEFLSLNIDTIIWTFITISIILIEVNTGHDIILWFMIGSILTLVLSLFTNNFIVQFVFFVLCSTFLMTLLYKRFKSSGSTVIKTNKDALIGRHVKVIKSISPKITGTVLVGDIIWTAKSTDTLESGEFVVVDEIIGNTLIVYKVK